MSPTALATATDLIAEAVAGMREGDTHASGEELRDMLLATRQLSRLVSQLQVETVAALERGGELATHGYRNPQSAVANALTLERHRAGEIVRAAQQVTRRVDLQGQTLPAVLAATAAVFAAGEASLAHVEVIRQLMHSPAAQRLTPPVRTGVEEQIAAKADEYTPTELRTWGTQLITAYDHDGPEPDDSDQPAQVNELRLLRLPGGGGLIKGRFEDPVRFATIATMIDAMSAPLNADEQRTPAERQADALADACGFVLAYGNSPLLPDTGGERPQVVVTLDHTDLKNHSRGGSLDFGGTPTPEMLRRTCCDAGIIPVVLGGAGQPLDIGRNRRTIPVPIRRAVAARDRGCAHPGCDRPPTWCEVHHIKQWSKGGATRVDNLVMLCHVHHREIHSTAWVVRITADGIPEFIPPTWLDREQKPRRQPRPPRRTTLPGLPPIEQPVAHALA